MPPSAASSAGMSTGMKVAAVAALGVASLGLYWLLSGSSSSTAPATRSASPTQQHAAAKKKKKNTIDKRNNAAGTEAEAAASEAASSVPPPSAVTPPPNAGFLNRQPSSTGSDSGSAPKSHGRIGSEFAAKRDYKRAIESYTLAIQENDSDHKLYTNRANVFVQLGRGEDALKDSLKSLQLKQTAGALLAKGNAHLILEQFDSAIETLLMVSAHPEATGAHIAAADKKMEEVKAKQEEKKNEQEQALQVQKLKQNLAIKAAEQQAKAEAEALREAQQAAAVAAAPDQIAPEATTSTARAWSEVAKIGAEHAAQEDASASSSSSATAAPASDAAPVASSDSSNVKADAAEDSFNPDAEDHHSDESSSSNNSNGSGVLVNASDVHSDNENGHSAVAASVQESAVFVAKPSDDEDQPAAAAPVRIEPIAEEKASEAKSPSPVIVSPVTAKYDPAIMHPMQLIPEAVAEPDAPATANEQEEPAAAEAAPAEAAESVSPPAAAAAPSAAASAAASAAPGPKPAAAASASSAPAPRKQKQGRKKPLKDASTEALAAATAAPVSSAAAPVVESAASSAPTSANRRQQSRGSRQASADIGAMVEPAQAPVGPTPLTPPPPATKGWASRVASATKAPTPDPNQ